MTYTFGWMQVQRFCKRLQGACASVCSTDQYLIEINASTSFIIRILFIVATRPRLEGEAMATVADYRKWAEECFEWARAATDDSVREQYASLGRVWLEQASRAELLSVTPSEPKTAQKVA